ncbi:MAG: HD domain-containing protein, partial [Oscillibacter sp.]|nr:HD domain-containing protein [Oscillibacter sp.]
ANSYSQIDPDGTLYLACSTGISSVNINDTGAGNSQVRLAVPFLTADDDYIPVHGYDEEIHIPASCKRLNVYANAFTYALYDPHLSYCLEGFDDEPIELTKNELGSITYTNLSGGTYRFRLSLLNILTGEADQTLTVTIVKDRALYEQPWFRILATLLVGVLLVGVTVLMGRKKTQALIRKQAETKRLVNEITGVFAECVDMKDAYTNGHSFRVAKYTAMMAEKLGKSKEEVEDIYNIALLHDIGKISIPDNILNKPGRLTDEEYAVMKSHSARGYEIRNEVQLAPELALGAGYHHERVDGKGYPRGVSADEIPEVAQIIAVADTFDAMFSTRPYRRKMALSDVAAEIQRVSGTQLSPRVVEVFMELVNEGAFDAEDTARGTEAPKETPRSEEKTDEQPPKTE